MLLIRPILETVRYGRLAVAIPNRNMTVKKRLLTLTGCLALAAAAQTPLPVTPTPVPQHPAGAPAPAQPAGTAPTPGRALTAEEEARAAAIRRMLQNRATNSATSLPRSTNAGSLNTGVPPAGAASKPRAFAPAVNPPQQYLTNKDTVVITPPPSNLPQEQMIPAGMIDFRNADLNQVLSLYAELVNRTILRPANLSAANSIFLKTQTPLTRSEAIQALEAVLAMNGIAFVNMGDKFVKAVPAANAGQVGAKFNNLPADQLPEMGSFVTHVVQLAYTKPSEMVQVLQPFASTIPNPIVPIESSQILVLRDYAENVKRMLEMIAKVDVSVPSEYVEEVIPIKYAKATEIASALNSLSSGGGATSVGGGGGGTTGSSRGVQRTVGAGGFNRGGYGAGGYGSTMGGYGGYPGSTMGTSPFGTTTPGTSAAGTSTGGSFTDRLRSIINKASTSGEINVLGQTKMIADERTNSLLIFASREDMKMIKEVIAKLDVVLAQVLIEAVIVEVTLGSDRDLGFSYLQTQPQPQSSGTFKGVGAINNTGGFSSFNDFASGSSNALSGGFSYLSRWNSDLDVLVKAVAQNNKARIIQRPRIQTSHNEPASLFVGESRPYPTGSYYGGGAYGGYSSIQQLPIGVTLTVTPLINPDGLVVMEISQDIQSANGFVNIANVGDVPITSQKSAQAKVSVRDRDTIILGGLIQNSKSNTRSGVPFLSDIPLLGLLFSANSSKESRSELIVMIRPTVLPTPEAAAVTAHAERTSMPLIKSAEEEFATEDAKQLRKANIHGAKDAAPKVKVGETVAPAVNPAPANSPFDESIQPGDGSK